MNNYLFALSLALCLVGTALAEGEEYCPWSSFISDSFCEYNDAAPSLGLGLGDDICARQETADDCQRFAFCYWRDTLNQNRLFQQNSNLCPPQIYVPAPNVYVAVGYGIANAILVEGDDGCVLVDTLDDNENAVIVKELMGEFVDFEAKPIKTIVYTHSHHDHWQASAVWGNSDTQLITHVSWMENNFRVIETAGSIIYRSSIMFGADLQPGFDGFASNGLGPYFGLKLPPDVPEGVADGLEIAAAEAGRPLRPMGPNWVGVGSFYEATIAGIDVEIYFAPGETNDQLLVWFPESKVACVGDNYYETFPNLYSIRGTTARHVKQWIQSTELTLSLQPEVVISSHTRPLVGAANVNHTMTLYRDAIKFVQDKTLQLLNRGEYPADIAAQMDLPEYLAVEPDLYQMYGTTRWSSLSVYDFYLGWYSGKIEELEPLSTAAEAARLVDLAGGETFALVKANVLALSHDMDDVRFGLKVASAIRTVNPDCEAATELFINMCTRLAVAHTSANGRNWYLEEAFMASQGPEAMEQRKKDAFREAVQVDSIEYSIEEFMTWMTILLDRERSGELFTSMLVTFTDAEDDEQAQWEIEVRRSVAYARAVANGRSFTSPELELAIHSSAFKQIVAGLMPAHEAFRSGAAAVFPEAKASEAEAAFIMSLFTPEF